MEVDHVATHLSVVHKTVGQIQRFIGECLEIGPHQQLDHLAVLLRDFPESSNPQHEQMLRGLLMEFSLEFGERVHKRLHDALDDGLPRSCPLKTSEVAISVWRDTKRPFPFNAVRAWGTGLRAAIDEHHPEIDALRLRDRINVNFALPLSSIVMSVASDASAAKRLRMHFHRIEGCSAHAYLTRRRVLAAKELLIGTSEKMETIAREVGWKSPKDFYRAVSNATGQTPAEIREQAERYASAARG